ncbi:MAG: nucleotidyl transferase AbiEii/AbiGii toxin family protein [bacterium]
MGKVSEKYGYMVSFYEKAVTSNCHKALHFLNQKEVMKEFYLAGGTALALQVGHRISTDLDWFSSTVHLQKNEREEIILDLNKSGEFEFVSEQDGMLFTRLFKADVSFIYQHHPLLELTIEYKGIQLASPADIGLMKLAAINSRGTRRDFVDIYCLRKIITLEKLLQLIAKKYADRPTFLAIAARALTYFEDAEQQPMPKMLISIEWNDVKNYCTTVARQLTRKLSSLE